MPPAAMSIGCTWRRTICSTSASSARAAVAAGIIAAASAAAITAAAITAFFPPAGCAPARVTTFLNCNVFAEVAELIFVHVIALGLLLTVRPRESGDPDSKFYKTGFPLEFTPAKAGAGMNGVERRDLGALPLPACGERVGVRGILGETQSEESPPHPLAALATSPRTRGEVEPAARSMLSSPVERGRVGTARRRAFAHPTSCPRAGGGRP